MLGHMENLMVPDSSLPKNENGEYPLVKLKDHWRLGPMLEAAIAKSQRRSAELLNAETALYNAQSSQRVTDMKKGLKDCDIVMMLRLQNERMTSSYLSSNREYYEYYGLTPDKLDFAKDDALIMHPGPMNRGIEIDTNLADDINKSVIKEQVELGVAVRMACLKIFCE